jgi:hypothetical protein
MSYVVRIVVAGVLLIAAGMKFYAAVVESRIFFGQATERWQELALVQFELAMGLWLLSGLRPRASWAAALGCFGLFAAVSFYKALTGETDCGCLGQIAINPWYMASFDVLVLGALLYFWPDSKSGDARPQSSRTNRVRVAAWMTTWLALAIAISYWMWPNIEPMSPNAPSSIEVDLDGN